ncbi:MAG: pyruvate kinase, partial [Eggerthella lenta]
MFFRHQGSLRASASCLGGRPTGRAIPGARRFSGGHAPGVRSGRLLGREEHACRHPELADLRSPSWARASESKDLAQRARIRRRLRSPLPLGDAALVCRLVGLGWRDGGSRGFHGMMDPMERARSRRSMARRTKIVCTLGPAVDDETALRGLLSAGMDVARFNF